MVKVYLDAATLDDIDKYIGRVEGFTTNPALMRKAGITDYRAFAKEVLARVGGKPVSFEVLADNQHDIRTQAQTIAEWSPNVYVKIPVATTMGVPLAATIEALAPLNLNITAVMTRGQIDWLAKVVRKHHIISVFAGRIADTGVHPFDTILYARDQTPSQILWASAREVFNIHQADMAECHIITLTPALIDKMALLGKDLAQYSRETVQEFFDAGRGITL